MKRLRVIPILLFLGMASPYLSIMVLGQYQRVLLILVRGLFDGQLHSISAFMSLAAIAAYIYRVRAGSGSTQDSLIIATLTVPVVLPSLLMVGLLLSPIGEQLPVYFTAAADLYLAGIASLAIVLPMLAAISHASSIILQRGTPAGAILMTMVTYGLSAFVLATSLTSVVIVSTGALLQQIGTQILLEALFVIQVIIANILNAPLPVVPSSFSPTLQLGAERIYTGALFAITSALYLYYRLFRKHSEEDISLEQSRTRPSRLNLSSLGSIGFAILLAVLLDFAIIVGVSRLARSTEIALQAGMMALMAIILIIGLGDSIRDRVRVLLNR